jgi:hypothetical protein
MFTKVVEGGHRLMGGGCLLAEISALFAGDRVQQIAWAAAGAATWLSHFLWDRSRRRRLAKDADRQSQRQNRLLDALEKRVRADINDGKPLTYPELVHLLADRDRDIEASAKDAGK